MSWVTASCGTAISSSLCFSFSMLYPRRGSRRHCVRHCMHGPASKTSSDSRNMYNIACMIVTPLLFPRIPSHNSDGEAIQTVCVALLNQASALIQLKKFADAEARCTRLLESTDSHSASIRPLQARALHLRGFARYGWLFFFQKFTPQI